MNRRRFLGLLGMTSTAYFFSPKGGWTQPPPIWNEEWRRAGIPQIEEAMNRQEAYMRGIVSRANGLYSVDGGSFPYPDNPTTQRAWLLQQNGHFGGKLDVLGGDRLAVTVTAENERASKQFMEFMDEYIGRLAT